MSGLVQGWISGRNNRRAADAEAEGIDRATEEQRRQFDVVTGLTAPGRHIGNQALNALGSIYGYSPYTPGMTVEGTAPEYVSRGGGTPSMNAYLYQSDPNYRRAWDETAAQHRQMWGVDYHPESDPGWINSQIVQRMGGGANMPSGQPGGQPGVNALAGGDSDRINALLGRFGHGPISLQNGDEGRGLPFGGDNMGQGPIFSGGKMQAPGGPVSPGNPGPDSTKPPGQAGPDYSNFFASPDYQFRRDEGMRNIENSFAARGGAASGNALRALTEFNSGLAAGEFGNYFNRQGALAGIGQAATNQQIGVGTGITNNISGLLADRGSARASGILGQDAAFWNRYDTQHNRGQNIFGMLLGGGFGR